MRYTKKKTAAEMCDKCPPLAPVLDTLRCELTDCRLENNIYQTPGLADDILGYEEIALTSV